jgi:hypothetical protein
MRYLAVYTETEYIDKFGESTWNLMTQPST